MIPASSTPERKPWNPFRVQREGGWMLYVWFGMRFSVWLRTLRRGGFDITLNCLPNVAAVTLWTPVNSLLAGLSFLLYGRRVARAVIPSPTVLVIGHWRTGTTLLHDLLSCDPRFSSPSTFDCLFPDHFLLTRRLRGRWMNVLLPKRRPMDGMAMGFDRPQEDEFALCMMGAPSPYAGLAFPRHREAYGAGLEIDELGGPERDIWSTAWLTFLRRLAVASPLPQVLKSPTHTARMGKIAGLLPDARFVHVARSPLAVLPSTIRLWRTLNSVQGLHNPAHDEAWVEEHVLATFARMFSAYERDRRLLPPQRLCEVRYEDLVADSRGVLRRIYEDLRLGDCPRAQAAVDAYLEGMGDYRPATYDIPARQCRAILDRWGCYLDRFGYRIEVEEALARAEAREHAAGAEPRHQAWRS